MSGLHNRACHTSFPAALSVCASSDALVADHLGAECSRIGSRTLLHLCAYTVRSTGLCCVNNARLHPKCYRANLHMHAHNLLLALAESTNIGYLNMQHADWDANPAEIIIGHTYHNKVNPGTFWICMSLHCMF